MNIMKALFLQSVKQLGLPKNTFEAIEKLVDDTVDYNNYDLMHREDGDVEYFSIDLDEESRNELLSSFWDEIPVEWKDYGKIYGKHMTIYYGDPRGKRDDIAEYIEQNLGEQVELTVTELGISDKAMAVRVTGNFITNNDKPHITLAIPAGSKAKFSNQIENWIPLEPFTLKGKISYTLLD